MKIINFGSLNMDKTYQVKEFVQSGQTISSPDLNVYPGGKGLNQSIAIARAGCKAVHTGAIGKDGEFLKQYLSKEGVITEYIQTVDGPSGHAVIQVNQWGQNCIIVYPGANHRISKEHIEQSLATTEKGDIVLIQNEINNVPYIMESTKRKSLKLVFNPSPVTEAILEYPLHMVDIFILNETEAAMLSGVTQTEEMLDRLEIKYPNSEIILTLGEKGSVYRYKSKNIKFGIFKTVCVDTTGAGDTFCGYYLSGIIEGMQPQKALAFASAAAAIAVSKEGAATSVPYRSEVESFSEYKLYINI